MSRLPIVLQTVLRHEPSMPERVREGGFSKRELPRTGQLTTDDCRALGERIFALAEGGETRVTIGSVTDGGVRWGRNLVSGAYDSTAYGVTITRWVKGHGAAFYTDRLDDAALAECVANAESLGAVLDEAEAPVLPGPQTYLHPSLRSPASASLTAAMRSSIAHGTVTPAVTRDYMAAGFLSVTDRATCIMNTSGQFSYFAETTAEYSTTIRDAAKRASGWAGMSSYDWARIDAAALGARALQKCTASANPVAVEPGRYTAILEPQAVADLMRFIPGPNGWSRQAAEQGGTHWSGSTRSTTKLGLKVLDERLTVTSDPMDPEVGYRPFGFDGSPLSRETWIEQGVLKTLAYSRNYAKTILHQDGYVAGPENGAMRVTGGTATLDDMIAATDRGVLVTRFNNIAVLDHKALVLTGNTRDGLWLVERGKISKAIRNFRFIESPLFAFNNVEQLGVPTLTYSSHSLFGSQSPLLVPPIRVRDFNFVATLDAV